MIWELRAGNCLDPVTGLASLADKSVDHVICDPPYSEHVHSKSMRGANGWKGAISQTRQLGFEHITQEQIKSISDQIARICKRWSLTFSDVENAHRWAGELVSSGMEYVRTGAWVKVGGAPQFTGDRPAVAFEAIVTAHPPGKKKWNGGGKAGVWSYPIVLERGNREKRYHTTQKPEALMEALVRDFTDPGDLIIDPFAGSGTTGVAAIRLGRHFIGWEKDPKYAEVAHKRLAATREQFEMFAKVGL